VSYYVGLPLILLLAVMEAAVLPLFRVSGLQPNLVLVLLICWLMLRGPNEAFVLIPFGGFVLGLVDGATLGTALLALAPLALLHEVRGAQLREGGFVLTVVFTVIMTLIYNLTYLLVFTVSGESGSWVAATTRVIIPTAFLNVVILLPIYFFVSLSSQELRRVGYA
jgi:rod shape-determining protein MreD